MKPGLKFALIMRQSQNSASSKGWDGMGGALSRDWDGMDGVGAGSEGVLSEGHHHMLDL